MTVILFFAACILGVYSPYVMRSIGQKKLKEHIAAIGGEIQVLSWEPGLLKSFSPDFFLVYRDKHGSLHECTVSITSYYFKIRTDRIVKEEDAFKPLIKEEPVTESKVFMTADGKITIHQTGADMAVGNKVMLDDKKAPDGKYKLDFLTYIYVKDGKIC